MGTETTRRNAARSRAAGNRPAPNVAGNINTNGPVTTRDDAGIAAAVGRAMTNVARRIRDWNGF